MLLGQSQNLLTLCQKGSSPRILIKSIARLSPMLGQERGTEHGFKVGPVGPGIERVDPML